MSFELLCIPDVYGMPPDHHNISMIYTPECIVIGLGRCLWGGDAWEYVNRGPLSSLRSTRLFLVFSTCENNIMQEYWWTNTCTCTMCTVKPLIREHLSTTAKVSHIHVGIPSSDVHLHVKWQNMPQEIISNIKLQTVALMLFNNNIHRIYIHIIINTTIFTVVYY